MDDESLEDASIYFMDFPLWKGVDSRHHPPSDFQASVPHNNHFRNHLIPEFKHSLQHSAQPPSFKMQFSLAVAAASVFYFASSAFAGQAAISAITTVTVSLNGTGQSTAATQLAKSRTFTHTCMIPKIPASTPTGPHEV